MPKPLFAENERVLCYHGPLLYEAKVIKAEINPEGGNNSGIGKAAQYLVHYKGWKQSWDEWVSESRLLKLSEENLRKQRSINETRRHDGADKCLMKDVKNPELLRPSSILDKGKKTEGRGTKRGRDVGYDLEEEMVKRPHLLIPLPDPLKIQLVDDWEAITRKNQVVTLPRNPNVKTILTEYEQYAINESTSAQAQNLINEVNAGLRVYFDRSLGHCLLYRKERQQYVEIRKKLVDKLPSEIYGAEHLLRLFVNLPEMISHTSMEAEVISIVRDRVMKIMDWLVLEHDRLFQSPYEDTSSAYQKINQSL